MKKLLAIAVVLATLLLGGCVGIPSAHMSGSIGVGPQGGYGQQYGVPGAAIRSGDGVYAPVVNPVRGYVGHGYFENRCKYKNNHYRMMRGC